MPWLETDPMNERLKFAQDARSDRFTMAKVAHRTQRDGARCDALESRFCGGARGDRLIFKTVANETAPGVTPFPAPSRAIIRLFADRVRMVAMTVRYGR